MKTWIIIFSILAFSANASPCKKELKKLKVEIQDKDIVIGKLLENKEVYVQYDTVYVKGSKWKEKGKVKRARISARKEIKTDKTRNIMSMLKSWQLWIGIGIGVLLCVSFSLGKNLFKLIPIIGKLF